MTKLFSHNNKSRIHVGFVISLALVMTMPVTGANAAAVKNKSSASKAVTNIQKLISKTTIELKSQESLKLNAELEESKNHSLNLASIEKNWQSTKSSFDSKTQSILSTIDKLSFFVVNVGNLGRCNGNCAVGTVLNLPFTPNDDFKQQGIDQNVKAGAMTPQNKSEYDKARSEYSLSLKEYDVIYGKFLQEKKDEDSRYTKMLAVIAGSYTYNVGLIEKQLQLYKKTLLAAKRAVKNVGNYEANFKIAYIFQYNLDMSYYVANSSFSNINSLMSAKAVLAAADDYETAMEIANSFNISKAEKFNKYLGSTYISDYDFKSEFAKALNVYRTMSV